MIEAIEQNHKAITQFQQQQKQQMLRRRENNKLKRFIDFTSHDFGFGFGFGWFLKKSNYKDYMELKSWILLSFSVFFCLAQSVCVGRCRCCDHIHSTRIRNHFYNSIFIWFISHLSFLISAATSHPFISNEHIRVSFPFSI